MTRRGELEKGSRFTGLNLVGLVRYGTVWSWSTCFASSSTGYKFLFWAFSEWHFGIAFLLGIGEGGMGVCILACIGTYFYICELGLESYECKKLTQYEYERCERCM